MQKEEPIRVVHIVGKMVGGGVESFLMNYYRCIDREKIQFDFIIDSDSTVVPEKEIKELGGKIIIVPPYESLFKYIKELKKVLKEYKIVHSHLNTLSVFPLYAAWRAKVPVRIAHSHSTTNRKEWKKNIIKNMLRPFAKVFATEYFACSEHAAKWLFGKKCVKKRKVTIIHNAIDVEKFKFNEDIRNRIRKEYDLEDKFVVGHVGRFTMQKNHEFLIDVFKEVIKERKNSVLLLVGDGPLENKIKNKVKKLGLQDNVKFLGIKNNVNELMQAMDCFLFPSLYEGLGIVVVEAQCSGVTCICSNEVPKEANITKLFKYCKLDDLDSWKKEILNNNCKRKNYANEITNKEYEINKEVKKLEEMYLKMK